MKIESIPYLWDGIFPKADIGFVTGPSDSNKTTFLRQLGYAIIESKDEFLGRKLSPIRNRVIFISSEDGVIATAAATFRQGTGSLSPEVQDRMIFVFRPLANLLELEPMIGLAGVDAIISDTWTDTYDGDINNAIQVRQNLSEYKIFARKHQCMFLLVHHSKKGSENSDPTKGHMLGSQALESAPRVVLDIRKDGERRKITVVKGNYTPEEIKRHPIYVQYNPDTMLLEVCDPSSGYGFDKLPDKEFFMPHLLELRAKGLTIDQSRKALGETFSDRKPPSHGSVSNWLREHDRNVSQSAKP